MRLFLIAILVVFATQVRALDFKDLTKPPPNPSQVFNDLKGAFGGASPPGAPGAPGVAGCSLDQLVKAAGDLGSIAKDQAEQLKKVNDELANTAKNVGDAQLAIIKKTTEEAGKVLLNPFAPLIDVAKHFLEYYNWLKDKLEKLAWQLVLTAGVVIGFPFMWFIRAITPRRKAA